MLDKMLSAARQEMDAAEAPRLRARVAELEAEVQSVGEELVRTVGRAMTAERERDAITRAFIGHEPARQIGPPSVFTVGKTIPEKWHVYEPLKDGRIGHRHHVLSTRAEAVAVVRRAAGLDGAPSDAEQFRRSVEAQHDRCPKCGGELDTGWECNDCGHDARGDMPGLDGGTTP